MSPKTTYELTFQPSFKEWSQRTIKKAMESANKQLGDLWVKNLRPQHFQVGAERVYGYANRTPEYEKAKARFSAGNPRPLIGPNKKNHKGGASKRMIESATIIRATTERLTVKQTAPSYFKNYSDKPPLADELTRFSADEENLIAKTRYPNWVRNVLMREPKRERRRF